MSFSVFAGDEQKLHLNLSYYANTIIENDMETFGINSKSGLINLIFSNFYEEAQASIGKYLDAEKNHLNHLCAAAAESLNHPESKGKQSFAAHLKSKNLSEKDITGILHLLSEEILQEKQKELTALADSYEKGPAFKVRIQNANYKYLTEGTSSFRNEFVKAVLEQYFLDQLKENILDDHQNFLNTVMAHLEERLTGKQVLNSKPSANASVGINVRVNNDNYEYLTEKRVLFPCREDKYYNDKAGKYVKAVIEEYCRLPLSRRSEICFRDILDTIQNACDNSLILKIRTHSSDLIYVYPYGVQLDTSTGHHYLVGYRAKHTEEKISAKKMVSLRLSNIQDIRALKDHSFISSDNRARLEKAIRENGCAYIDSGKACDIEVFLTREGKRLYNTQPANRPVYREIKGDIYKFHCTPYQIRVYFFKFGIDARIISPADLANRFRDDYLKAAEQYGHIS